MFIIIIIILQHMKGAEDSAGDFNSTLYWTAASNNLNLNFRVTQHHYIIYTSK